MLVVSLNLEVGYIAYGEYILWDSFALETNGNSEQDCETVHSILSNPSCDSQSMARLYFEYSLNHTIHRYLISSFSRAKDGKWILTK